MTIKNPEVMKELIQLYREAEKEHFKTADNDLSFSEFVDYLEDKYDF